MERKKRFGSVFSGLFHAFDKDFSMTKIYSGNLAFFFGELAAHDFYFVSFFQREATPLVFFNQFLRKMGRNKFMLYMEGSGESIFSLLFGILAAFPMCTEFFHFNQGRDC